MEQSVRVVKQEKKITKSIGNNQLMNVFLRFDDRCRNGHNTFAITAEIRTLGRRDFDRGGCLHEEIKKYFPELAYLIPYHLCSTDGPMHYIANTIHHASSISKHQNKWYFYLENKLIRIVDAKDRNAMVMKYGEHCVFTEYPDPMAKEPNLEYARESAIWPDASLEQLRSKEQLEKRLPELLSKFREEMINLGFTW